MIIPRGVVFLGIVAVLSLALNLFLAGDLLGRHFHRVPAGHEFEARLGWLFNDMPNPDRKLAHDIMQQHSDLLLQKWRAARTAGQRAMLSLRATPFDPNDAKADLARWNDRIADFRTAFQDTMLEIAGKVSADGRAHLQLGPGH